MNDAAGAPLIVGHCARRWTIERLHYTLKSGLASEELQLDNVRALSRCLALYYIVAWRLMYIAYLDRGNCELTADLPRATRE